MRRSLILICVLSMLCLGTSLWVDITQQQTAREYLQALPALREAVLQNNMAEAFAQHAMLYANWQHDVRWLNFFVSHHHTRAVTTAMAELATAMEQGWEDEALRGLDSLKDALEDVAASDFPYLENIL